MAEETVKKLPLNHRITRYWYLSVLSLGWKRQVAPLLRKANKRIDGDYYTSVLGDDGVSDTLVKIRDILQGWIDTIDEELVNNDDCSRDPRKE